MSRAHLSRLTSFIPERVDSALRYAFLGPFWPCLVSFLVVVLANTSAATSNAPHVGRKRRMADEDRDEDEDEQARLKKSRGASEPQPDAQTALDSSSTPLPQAKETEAVKEVTQGVKEVELEEKPQALPESVPLPEEKAGELDAESSSTASTPPPTGESSEAQDAATVPDIAALSGDVVSDSSVAETKEPEPTTDAAEVAATSDVAPVATTDARPIKKLRAKPASKAPAPEPVVAPTEG